MRFRAFQGDCLRGQSDRGNEATKNASTKNEAYGSEANENASTKPKRAKRLGSPAVLAWRGTKSLARLIIIKNKEIKIPWQKKIIFDFLMSLTNDTFIQTNKYKQSYFLESVYKIYFSVVISLCNVHNLTRSIFMLQLFRGEHTATRPLSWALASFTVFILCDYMWTNAMCFCLYVCVCMCMWDGVYMCVCVCVFSYLEYVICDC